MMNTDIEFRNHLAAQFLTFPQSHIMITEDRHRYNKIDELVDYFNELFSETIDSAINNKLSLLKIEEGQIPIETFFSNYKITLKISYGKNSFSSGFNPQSIYQNYMNMWVCYPNVNFNITAKTLFAAHRLFRQNIAHELTHAYNLLQYAIQNNDNPMNSVIKQNYYNFTKGRMMSGNYGALSDVLYRLNRMERNAIIAQMNNELKSFNLIGATFQDVYDLAIHTNAYRNFKSIEKNVGQIFATTDKSVQDSFITTINELVGKNFTTYNQVKRYFYYRWLKWSKAFMKNTSKLIYDVYYQNNNNVELDGGVNSNKNFTIK